jgi:hypothetical protein
MATYTVQLVVENRSVADPRCLSRIRDPNFSISDPGARAKKAPDPGSGIRNKELLTQIIVSNHLEIRPGIFIAFFSIPDAGSKS